MQIRSARTHGGVKDVHVTIKMAGYGVVRRWPRRHGRGISDGGFDGVSAHSSSAVHSDSQTRGPHLHPGVLEEPHSLALFFSATLNLLMKMAIAILFPARPERDLFPHNSRIRLRVREAFEVMTFALSRFEKPKRMTAEVLSLCSLPRQLSLLSKRDGSACARVHTHSFRSLGTRRNIYETLINHGP